MKTELILCSKTDEELKNYYGIFDEIEVRNQNDHISFTLVCKVNFEGENVKTVTLHFFLFNETDKKKLGLYLSEGTYERETDYDDERTDDFKIEFKDVPLSGVGNYALEVVRNDGMRNADGADGPKVYRAGETIGRITFLVKEYLGD